MDRVILENKNSLVRASDFDKTKKKIVLEISKIKKSVDNDEQWYRALAVPYNKKIFEQVEKVARQKKKLNPAAILVIGIGGSILGCEAVYVALRGKLHNETEKIKVFFLDTVDADMISNVYKIAEDLLKLNKNILLNVITESGKTTETISNFQIFLNLLKKYKKNYSEYVVVSTLKNTNLYSLAVKEKFDLLEIPEGVGGRYSVFTHVGLFPLCFTGIDVKKLILGAKEMNNKFFKEGAKSISAQFAADMYCNYREGKYIHDLFIFGNDLESLGKWYRQLLAESLGKKYTTKGTKVNTGITPTVSIGSTDLHSMGQLYLSGPSNRFTTFMKVEPRRKIKVPNAKEYKELVMGVQGRDLNEVMNAILNGTKIAFIKSKKPFNQISISKTEYDIGAYMQLEMIKVIIIGHLLNVNPFDQPNVEEYKQETREILKK